MQLIFNELSLNENAPMQEGIGYFCNFINTYSRALKEGFDREIVTYIDLNTVQIAQDYYSFQWRNSEKDRDIVRRYQGLCDRQSVCSEDELTQEVLVNGKSGKGILFALIHDEILFSIRGQKVFEEFNLIGQHLTIEEDEENVGVINISCIKDIEDNTQLWKIRQKTEYEKDVDRDQFVEKLSEYYPHLEFGKVAIDQLKNEIENQHFKTIRMKLYELESVFAGWNGGQLTDSMFQSKMSPQSPETLKRFEEPHTFRVGNKIVIASYHIRYTGQVDGRIYFYPDSDSKKCLICSLTTKLPTVSNPKKRI